MSEAAFDAAIKVAREAGIMIDQPRVLSDDQNLLVHLAPSPVVARVATRIAWSRPDPEAWLRREVAVATHAPQNAGPVVAPTRLMDPGPHRRDGYAMTFWTYAKSTERLASKAEAGDALARLHRSLQDYPASSLPDRLPVHAQIENGLAALARDGVVGSATLETLGAMHEQLSAELATIDGTKGVIHGDAHPWNLLFTEGTWRWIDLEETGFGPREFDLAVLATKVDDADAALFAYAATMGSRAPDKVVLVPFERIRELESVIWGLGMAVTDPSHRDAANQRLERLLKGNR
jgi:Ser/Thr protein kinase RdoA (MazF antagonist)